MQRKESAQICIVYLTAAAVHLLGKDIDRDRDKDRDTHTYKDTDSYRATDTYKEVNMEINMQIETCETYRLVGT